MKCMADRRAEERYLGRATDRIFRDVTNYFPPVAASVLIDKFQWLPERVNDFLFAFFDQHIAVNEGYISVEDIAQMLIDDYSYTVELRHKCEQSKSTRAVRLRQQTTDFCICWTCEIMALVLLDKFGWDTQTVTRFIRNIDGYVGKFADGGKDHVARIARLREQQIDIKAHIR